MQNNAARLGRDSEMSVEDDYGQQLAELRAEIEELQQKAEPRPRPA